MTTLTQNYQFAFNDWVFGGLGAGVQILEVQGLEDLPDMRVQDANRGYADGMWTGRDFLSGRTITFKLQIMNNANGTMQQYLSDLKANLLYQTTGTGVLQFKLPTRSQQRVVARVRKRALKIDPEYSYGRSEATVEFFCPDPRIYDDAEIVGALVPGAGLARTYNRTYNLTYSTPLSAFTSAMDFTNSGNVTVFPKFTMTGSCSNPVIFNTTTGQRLQMSVTLGASDVLVLDTDLRTVTLNGGYARNVLAAGSTWFGFPPGVTSLGVACVTTSGSSLSVSYRNGYV